MYSIWVCIPTYPIQNYKGIWARKSIELREINYVAVEVAETLAERNRVRASLKPLALVCIVSCNYLFLQSFLL